jgi:CheY-like chemotaxis protein
MMKAVICVDDDELITRMLNFQLMRNFSSQNVLFECVNDPLKTIGVIKELELLGIQVVLLITDYQMPQLNGDQLVNQIKQKFPLIKCVLLSGQANDTILLEMKNEKRIDAFVMKPWHEEELIKLVEKYLN